ncbi:MAG: hypothetical protein ACLR6J_17620 [Parabacteroides merdae]
MDGIISCIFMPEQLPADNCRQTTTTAEKSNYQKENQIIRQTIQ